MKVTWEVDDGYCGKSRPHVTIIPDDELKEFNKKDQEKLINEYIQEDFQQMISWYIVSKEN